MKTICVLMGGRSSERKISLLSGAAVAAQLKKSGYKMFELDPQDFPTISELIAAIKSGGADVVFLALHGGEGENGKMQAAFELAQIPFTGSGSRACCITMDKYTAKLIARDIGVPTADFIVMHYNMIEDYNTDEDLMGFLGNLGLPVVVKPNDGGSSVGVSIVKQIQELKPAVELAFRESNVVLVEKYIAGAEFAVTVLEGKALPVVEIKPVEGWYDYTNKYTEGKTVYVAPAEIDPALSRLLQVYATRLWQAFDLKGYARVDFLYDGDQAWFLEANTLPGMTSLSLTPMAAKTVGIDFAKLLEIIINNA